jgi:tetratricopeptide (TPR) repeat protein
MGAKTARPISRSCRQSNAPLYEKVITETATGIVNRNFNPAIKTAVQNARHFEGSAMADGTAAQLAIALTVLMTINPLPQIGAALSSLLEHLRTRRPMMGTAAEARFLLAEAMYEIHNRGDLSQAIEWLQWVRLTAHTFPNLTFRQEELLANYFLMRAYTFRYEYKAAHECAQQAEELGSEQALPTIRMWKIWADFQLHRQDSQTLLGKAELLLPQAKDPYTTASLLRTIARIKRRQRHYVEAIATLKTALECYPEDHPGRVSVLTDQAFVFRLLAGQSSDSKRYREQSNGCLDAAERLCLRNATWYQRSLTTVWVNRGLLLIDERDWARAYECAERARGFAGSDMVQLARVDILYAISLLLKYEHDHQRATLLDANEHIRAAIANAKPTDHIRVQQRGQIWRGMIALKLDRLPEAEECLEAIHLNDDDHDYLFDEHAQLVQAIQERKKTSLRFLLPNGDSATVERLQIIKVEGFLELVKDQVILMLIDSGRRMGDIKACGLGGHTITEVADTHHRPRPLWRKS